MQLNMIASVDNKEYFVLANSWRWQQYWRWNCDNRWRQWRNKCRIIRRRYWLFSKQCFCWPHPVNINRERAWQSWAYYCFGNYIFKHLGRKIKQRHLKILPTHSAFQKHITSYTSAPILIYYIFFWIDLNLTKISWEFWKAKGYTELNHVTGF